MTTPLVIGHRGAPGYRPEHTRESYRLALELGADAVEPDIVPTRDGVLVLRHENEISGTTDVARRPEFASRRTTKSFAGVTLTGWFTEDFTWEELATLRSVERIPRTRPDSADFDGTEPILRLEDLLGLLEEHRTATGRTVGLVAEVKHPTYFAAIGLPVDGLIADALAPWSGRPELYVECFEQTILRQLRGRGLAARYVYLLEAEGAALDLLVEQGLNAPSFASQLTDAGLDALAAEVDGISVDKSLLITDEGRVDPDALVERAHSRGLDVFTWTLRPENRFLAKAHRLRGGKEAWGDWQREFELVLGTGLDGAFFDHPDLGVEARELVVGRP